MEEGHLSDEVHRMRTRIDLGEYTISNVRKLWSVVSVPILTWPVLRLAAQTFLGIIRGTTTNGILRSSKR